VKFIYRRFFIIDKRKGRYYICDVDYYFHCHLKTTDTSDGLFAVGHGIKQREAESVPRRIA
jgi:hypothetical protein